MLQNENTIPKNEKASTLKEKKLVLTKHHQRANYVEGHMWLL